MDTRRTIFANGGQVRDRTMQSGNAKGRKFTVVVFEVLPAHFFLHSCHKRYKIAFHTIADPWAIYFLLKNASL